MNAKQRQILNIITGTCLYQKVSLDQSIFETDLVIKLKFPSQSQRYVSKGMSLSELIVNPQVDLQQAYRLSYQKLLQQSNKKQTELTIRIANQTSIYPINNHKQKQYQVILQNGNKTKTQWDCSHQCTNRTVDLWTLQYNTLVYVLQQKCGFKVNSYIQEEQDEHFVYLLLHQQMPNLLRAAHRFGIKKEVDYAQLDLFLNQPKDQYGRSFQNNSDPILHTNISEKVIDKIQPKIKQQKVNIKQNKKLQRQQYETNHLFMSKKIAIQNQNEQGSDEQRTSQLLKKTNKSNKMIQIKPQTGQEQKRIPRFGYQEKIDKKNQLTKQNSLLQLYKRVHRNMRNKNYILNQRVVDEHKLSKGNYQKVEKYMVQFFYQFDRILHSPVELSPQQKDYVLGLNRLKPNPKSEKQYILKQKRKKAFHLIKSLSSSLKYKIYSTPLSFFPFILPSKHLSFLQKLRGLLIYQQTIVSPYGDCQLFCRMDRIKVSYRIIKEVIRIGGIVNMKPKLFAIHHDYQKFGIMDVPLIDRKIDRNAKGGINGQNVMAQWNPLTPWTINLVTLRNYFGENTVYQTYLKTHLIQYFILIIPLHILALFLQIYFSINDFHPDVHISYHKLLLFHMIFFTILIGLFAYFMQMWLDNFVDDLVQKTWRTQFQGHFTRDQIRDHLNQRTDRTTIASNFKKFTFFLLIFLILAAECGIFYGLRKLIVKLSIVFVQTNIFLISWPHLLGYGIFFIFNLALYEFIICRLCQKLTNLQNIATQDQHKRSSKNKKYMFLIGIELIGPIFLLILEPLAKTSCYASLCFNQFQQYIYSRYIIVFCFLLIKLSFFLIVYFKSKSYDYDNKTRYQLVSFDKKLQDYISKIRQQSQKQQHIGNMSDQTLVLLHYSMFCTTFPISAFLGLLSMILEYSIQRLQLLHQKARPISKSQPLDQYSQKYSLFLHLSIFINVWIIFFTMEQVQYTFQQLIKFFIGDTPTWDTLFVFKIVVVALVILIFQIFVKIIRYLASDAQALILNRRKHDKYNKYIKHNNYSLRTKATLNTQKIHPFRTIFRTYPLQQVAHFNNKNNQQNQQQDIQLSTRSYSSLKQ